MQPQDTLSRRISQKQELVESEIAVLVNVLGGGCREKRKEYLRQALEAVPHIRDYGIYGRVHLTPTPRYCAGQSYPDELRIVRQCLTGY